MDRPALTLVLPARDEAALIADTVLQVTRYLEDLEPSYELIVGDSGSRDGTGDRVRDLRLPKVRVIRADLPGKGRILTRCLRQAHGDVVGFLDADLEIPIETLGQLLQEVRRGADVAIASKSAAMDRRPWRRRLATALLNGAIRVLFRSALEDHQAGCKLFRADVLRAVLPTVRTTGWLWDTEVLVGLRRTPIRIAQVGFEPQPSRPSRLSPWAMAGSLWDLVVLRVLSSRLSRIERGPQTAPVEAPSAHA